jgi:hypothetical protein
MIKLDLNGSESPSWIRSRIGDIYDRIAGSGDYERNSRSLTLIQFCVITVSAMATGYVNAFAHKERIGWIGAGLLAVLITVSLAKIPNMKKSIDFPVGSP